MDLNPSKPVLTPPTKEQFKNHYNKVAMDKYSDNVYNILKANTPTVPFPKQAIAEQLFSLLSATPTKKYMYINPETLNFIISDVPVSHMLYILVYHPNPDTTPWLITNMLSTKDIVHFRNNEVLYAIK